MNERPKPSIEITKLTETLMKLQGIKEAAARTAQSVDDSDRLVGSALIAGLANNEIKRQRIRLDPSS